MGRSLVGIGKLTVQHEKLALSYAICGDRKTAMKDAGYKCGPSWSKTASKLFNNPKIVRRINEHLEAIASKATTSVAVSREWIRSELVDNVKRAKSAIPVLDSHGNPTGEWKCDLPTATRTLELLGKESGMFADKLITENLDVALDGKTPEQIESVMKALIAEIGPTTIRRYLAETEQNEPGAAQSSGAGEDVAGVPPEEAGTLPAVSEAGGVPSGRLLQ